MINKKKKKRREKGYFTPRTKNRNTNPVAVFVLSPTVAVMVTLPNPRTFDVRVFSSLIPSVVMVPESVLPLKMKPPVRVMLQGTMVAFAVPLLVTMTLTAVPPAIDSMTMLGSLAWVILAVVSSSAVAEAESVTVRVTVYRPAVV